MNEYVYKVEWEFPKSARMDSVMSLVGAAISRAAIESPIMTMAEGQLRIVQAEVGVKGNMYQVRYVGGAIMLEAEVIGYDGWKRRILRLTVYDDIAAYFSASIIRFIDASFMLETDVREVVQISDATRYFLVAPPDDEPLLWRDLRN